MLLNLTYGVAGLIIFLALYLAIKTNIIRASSANPNSKYSFTNTQMMWWTVIVSCAFIILYGKTGDYGTINQSTVFAPRPGTCIYNHSFLTVVCLQHLECNFGAS